MRTVSTSIILTIKAEVKKEDGVYMAVIQLSTLSRVIAEDVHPLAASNSINAEREMNHIVDDLLRDLS